ncbi:hypothetical protein [Amycolatopsis sp. NPDC051071]|uniref:hypothetical protein n=1 Tax=Amycolatopsis sp. NPDC051071 TaxID=3154637 RepID=UPI00342CD2E0
MFPSTFRVPVAPSLASTLAEYDLVMDGHTWAEPEVTRVRKVLRAAGAALVHRLADRLALDGCVVAALPSELSDDLLHRAAAGVVAAAGTPFCPIGGGRALWLDGTGQTGLDDGPTRDLGIELPDVTAPPDYASLLRLGPGPAGGGQVVVADLRSAAVLLANEDRDVLRRPVFGKDRSGHVRGVGGPMLPFPVLEDGPPGMSWIRWSGTLPTTATRGTARHSNASPRCWGSPRGG